MPIENADWITDLNPANPPDQDPHSQAAAQIRLIKGRLVATFPNVKSQVTASHNDLNNVLLQLRGQDDTNTVPVFTSDDSAATTPITNFGKVLLSLANQDQMVQVINAYVPTTGGVMSGGLVCPVVTLNDQGTFSLQSPEGYATILMPNGFYIQQGARGTLIFGAAGVQVAEIDAAGNLNLRGKVTEDYGF